MRALLAAFLIAAVPLSILAERPVPDSQQESKTGDITPIFYSSLRSSVPTFLSADVTILPDGQLNTDLMDDRARFVMNSILSAHQEGCVEIEENWIDRVNPPDRSSLGKAVGTSALILEGRVVGRDYGFYQGYVPGQLLEIETEEVLRGNALAKHFIFVPIGTFTAGPYTFCKTDSRLPEPPDLGDRVLLLIHRLLGPEEPFLDLYDDSSLIVLPEQGAARLPASLRTVDAPGLTRADLLSEVKRELRGQEN